MYHVNPMVVAAPRASWQPVILSDSTSTIDGEKTHELKSNDLFHSEPEIFSGKTQETKVFDRLCNVLGLAILWIFQRVPFFKYTFPAVAFKCPWAFLKCVIPPKCRNNRSTYTLHSASNSIIAVVKSASGNFRKLQEPCFAHLWSTRMNILQGTCCQY